MVYEVDEETIRLTTDCRLDFQCLTGDLSCMCTVEELLTDVLFVRPEEPALHCPYLQRFGEGFFCSCPTRRALYKRYGV